MPLDTPSYDVARAGDRIGHAFENIAVRIQLGLKRGYSGLEHEKQAVLDHLAEMYAAAMRRGETCPSFIVKDSVIVYVHRSELVVLQEPGLELTSSKSPLHGDETDEEWQALVERYAKELAGAFQQFRVYIEYYRSEIKILELQPEAVG